MHNTTYPYRNPSPDGLGKLLFERRRALYHVLVACLVVLPFGLFLAAGLGMIVVKQGLATARDLGMATVILAMCVGCGFYAWYSFDQYSLMRVHEGGVSKRSWGRTRSLLFSEIDRFWFGGSHVYVKGAYLGASYALRFFPAPISEKRPLRVELPAFRWNAREKQSDKELENLRDWMYQMLSARMRLQMESGQPVEWIKHLRFLPEGLYHHAKGWSGEKTQVHPYASIHRVEMDWFGGKAKIFLGDGGGASITENVLRQPNGVPGLMLLEWLCKRSRE